MFKKKNDQNPWPEPPINDQVLEDVTSAPENDPVFQEGIKAKSVSSHKSDVDESYERLKDFLDVNKKLEKVMQDLDDRNNCLQGYNTDLQKMVQDIRQKAFDALN